MATTNSSVCKKCGESTSKDTETESCQQHSVVCLQGRLRWKVKNWSHLKDIYKQDAILYSEPFRSSSQNVSMDWRFGISPKPTDGSIGIYFNALGCKIRTDATITVSIVSSDQSLTQLVKFSRDFHSGQQNWRDLVDAKKITLHVGTDDAITFVCNVHASIVAFVIDTAPSCSHPIDADKPFHGFEHLYKSGYMSDIMFKVGDELINCHKCVLGCYSPIFAALFSNSKMMESNTGIIEISDCSASGIKAMLEFIYTGSVTSLDETVEELLMLSDKYELVTLKAFSEKHLLKEIKTETANHLLRLADLHNSVFLKERIVKSVAVNWQEVFNSADWGTLKKTNSGLTIFVLENVMRHTMPALVKTEKP